MHRAISVLWVIPLVAAVLTDTMSHALDEELQTIPTRPSVTQAFLFVKPVSRPPRSHPCDGLSYHGFFGLELGVVDAIAGWIRATSGGM